MTSDGKPVAGVKTNIAVAVWQGDWRARVSVGDGFELLVDEPLSVVDGTGTGPQPTDYFMASIASCYALALAWAARKRQIRLDDLTVQATGIYDGPQFSRVVLTVQSSLPHEQLTGLLEPARRACYVSNTIALSPQIDIELAPH